jgi:hypothetical protein
LNVAFLANSFHLSKTKSTDFLIDLLREWFGGVTVIPHKEAWARLPGTNWDLIVVFQKIWGADELEAFGARRTVLVPMYDDCPKARDAWDPYQGFGILSFSRTLGADLKAWGHDVLTVQYWQEVPREKPPGTPGLRGFFWPRTKALGWSQVRPLLGDSHWDSFHLHVTNAEGATSLPSEDEKAIFRVVQTSWFEDSADARAAVARSNVYFAPRTAEGIGQAVLEAMALGLCVVAPDAPTMNEYIVHGTTGLLYDPNHPTALDFGQVEELGRNARQAAIEGRSRWEASCGDIRKFLLSPSRPRPHRFHPFIIVKGRLTALLRTGFRLLKRLAGRA